MSALVVDLVTPTREQCLDEAADVLVQAAIRIGRERHELARRLPRQTERSAPDVSS